MDFFGIIVIASILCFFVCKKLLEYLRHKRLFDHVSWCVNNANSTELYYYRINELVSPQYRLDACDMPFVKVILEAYKKNLSSLFFQKRLFASRNFTKLQSRDYFFLTFKHYLIEHECDGFFQDEKLYDTVKIKYYEGDGTEELCRLTPDGLTYAKVLHLVSTYCISNRSINSNHASIDSINYLKRQIESGTTTISRYRP